MSDDSFYGRPIPKGKGAISFDVCEVCQQRTPTWAETNYETDTTVIIRFTCDECHERELDPTRQNEEAYYTRTASEDESPAEVTRPAWMEEFIEAQQESGAIESIGETEEIAQDAPDFSEPEKEFETENLEIEEEEVPEETAPLAHWSASFIQEALFGPNPEEWLENQGAFAPEALALTVTTLSSFASNQVSGVKLSAILCLAGVVRRDSSYKDQVLQVITSYSSDEDESVSQFAQQTLDQLK
ncbi:MAG: hypothetical protein ACXAB7_05590 [Candidatus Kariarchaeaceae archaeon]|jgi:hypothetical protein